MCHSEHTCNAGFFCLFCFFRSNFLQVERNNDLQINVFGCEQNKVYLLRLARSPDDAINLMLLHDDERKAANHWVWIKNFGRLCSDKRRRNGHPHYCMRCLSSHNSVEGLRKHQVRCPKHDTARVEIPKEERS